MAFNSSLYNPLSRCPTQIRLVTLHHSVSDEEAPRCTLQTVDIKSSRPASYTALSYVWGDPSVVEDIFINGLSVAVTSNLGSALRHIRRVFGETVLWVDAICENRLLR
jgi:Heterokaryon incompatibility protein (HET)